MENFSIQKKLVLSFLFATTIAVTVTGLSSYWQARDALQDRAMAQLSALRTNKAMQIEHYMKQIENQIVTLSESHMVIKAMKEFSGAFNELRNEKITEEMQAGLMGYYNHEFLKRLNRNTGKQNEYTSYLPDQNASLYLQFQYIVNNPSATGEKLKLDYAHDNSRYSRVHQRYHPAFRNYLQRFGLYDIFLVDSRSGDIVYTVFKEVDFATNLLTGPYKDSNFSRAFREVKDAADPEEVRLIDFQFYEPSYGAPASFIASPVFDEGEQVGVLVFQMPIDEINNIMTDNQKWQESGLGKTGEAFLIGDDYKMRSASRFLIEDKDTYFKNLAASGYDTAVLDEMRTYGSPILLQTIKTEATEDVFRGISANKIITDYRGERVLNSYSPLNISGVNWAIISKIDEDEAFASVYTLRNFTFFWGFIILLLAGAGAFWYGRKFARPIVRITEVAKNISRGDLRDDVDYQGSDEIGELAESFREMGRALQEKAAAAKAIARGDLDVQIKQASEADDLGMAMQTMKDKIQKVVATIQETIEHQKQGQLSARCDLSEMEGAFATLVRGVNEALDAVIDPMKSTIEVIGEYAAGDLEKRMNELPGEQKVLSGALNEIRSNLMAVIDEGLKLSEEAARGNLQYRGDKDSFSGAYGRIIDGFNKALDAAIEPVNESLSVLNAAAAGDLTARVTGDYKGDHAKIKTALNHTLDALDDVLGQVNEAVAQVSEGAKQVSDNSQSVSQGATEQASSLEEISASMTEINSQARSNAENTEQAQAISEQTKVSADTGNEHMQRMMDSITNINDASREISKIIKAIDEIAFQTNLLSLNAAVEAARAGVHGKGFAVVAEEVRNLAQRSAKAAQETAELIEGSVSKAREGLEIAKQTGEALGEIISGITKSKDLIDEIALASREQVSGIEQTTLALAQIDKVTQSNTASAEESAAASEELSGQADTLKQVISRFKLSSTRHSFVRTEPEEQTVAPPAEPEFITEGFSGEALAPEEEEIKIELSDHDFGDF
ncbi:MAG TPA: methyl-accepting chemotaxis protein [Caldithrix abyssi]|uniref:Methyl-accepting chemotaxis protein n=1 Tax=Caldithrix abyssi TaxID=187145 RepID=A0A7V1PVA0_CALAY|nr:methyl-accepting chemotaxis protein [Caldithrix abyssi]